MCKNHPDDSDFEGMKGSWRAAERLGTVRGQERPVMKAQLTAQDRRNNAMKLRIDAMKGACEGPLVKLCCIRRPQCWRC